MVEMREVNINGRWKLNLPEHRAERPQWPWWEATRLAAMHHFIQPGDVVYDIGAEEGDFPALFASWGAYVALVEPNPRVWPNIKAIFDNNRRWIDEAPDDRLAPLGDQIIGSFVGFASDHCEDASNGQAPWGHARYIGQDWPNCAYGEVIGDHGFRHLAQETDTTPQITIDALAEFLVLAPDHITMDIEGAEFHALTGASRVLRECRPYVWASIHGKALYDFFGKNGADVLQLMAEHGYEGVFLTEDHEAHWLFVPEEKMWPR